MKCWRNGELRDADDPAISPHDRGFLLGDGLFETIFYRAGALILGQAHLARLRAGSEMLGIPLPHSDRDLENACLDVAQGRQSSEDLAIRITLSRGPGGRGVALPLTPEPTCLITAGGTPDYTKPFRLKTASIRRNTTSPLSRLKSLNYLDNILARRQAMAEGYDDALILNTEQRVACTSIANIWLVEGNHIITPPAADGVLEGTVRGKLIELLASGPVQVDTESFNLTRLKSADACFLTNSLMGVLPISAIDETSFQTAPVDPIKAHYEAWLESLFEGARI